MSIAGAIRGVFPSYGERSIENAAPVEKTKPERRVIPAAQFASMSHDELIEFGQNLKLPTLSEKPDEKTSERLLQLRQQLEELYSR